MVSVCSSINKKEENSSGYDVGVMASWRIGWVN
jgi:hypothetical protein